jgi:hypothetical protein
LQLFYLHWRWAQWLHGRIDQIGQG